MKAMWLALVLMLGGCTAANEPTIGKPAIPAPATQAPVLPSPVKAPEPEAARRVPEDLLTQNGVYYGCKTPADCEVKDVGNCCGYYPACVNKDSPTFPEQAKADCAKDGMSSICGFPSISSCDCVEGRCTAINGPSNDSGLPLE